MTVDVPNFDQPFDDLRARLNEAAGAGMFQDRRYYDPRPSEIRIYASGPQQKGWEQGPEDEHLTFWITLFSGASESDALAHSKSFREGDPEFRKALDLLLEVLADSQRELRAFNPSGDEAND